MLNTIKTEDPEYEVHNQFISSVYCYRDFLPSVKQNLNVTNTERIHCPLRKIFHLRGQNYYKSYKSKIINRHRDRSRNTLPNNYNAF